MKLKHKKLYTILLILAPVLMGILFTLQVLYINDFNSQVYTVSGADSQQTTYLDIEPREDSTSTWLKRDFEWEGQTIDLSAQTIDGVLYNNSDDEVDDWSIEMDITDKCFINNAWCGLVTIRQYTGTENEQTQTLDLRDYDLDEVKLDYFYDGDLLIPLIPGDHVTYTPSAKDSEVPVAGDSELTMGVIFYYFDSLDFMKYDLNFSYHRSYTQGLIYPVIFVIGMMWIVGLAVYIVSLQLIKNAEHQLELQKSGIACMSDIYHSIYIVDLKNDILTPVIEKGTGELHRPEELPASQQIHYLFETDTADAYREVAISFCELSTIAKRLGEKNSIALEYISKSFGWCAIRFFAMDRIPGRPIDKVLFTIQNIDAEKREMDEIEERITIAEREQREVGAFLKSISDEILIPAREISKDNQSILQNTGEEATKAMAEKIDRSSATLAEIIRDVLDYARLEAGQLTIAKKPFSIESLLREMESFAKEYTIGSKVEVKYDIADTLPAKIYGDKERLMRIMAVMVVMGVSHMSEGSITCSLFGKATEQGMAHLVFSVRDKGEGAPVDIDSHIGTRLAEGVLKMMGSALRVVSTPGNGTETYFELDARVADDTKIGKIDI